MKEFFKKLLSDSTEVSSKRLMGTLSFIFALIFAFISIYIKIQYFEEIFDGLLWFSAGCFSFTSIDGFFKSKKENNDYTPPIPPVV